MVDDIRHFFWDSCVFRAYLGNMTVAYDVDSIEQYLEDAKEGKCVIFTSSIALAEVVPSSILMPKIGTFQDFVEDFHGSIVVIDATPNVMILAGALKDIPYKKGDHSRKLSTGDAIMLASCIHIIESYGVKIDVFHTFDDGKTRDPVHGKMVPLLSYDEWCSAMSGKQTLLARRVLTIIRKLPIYPAPKLFSSYGFRASQAGNSVVSGDQSPLLANSAIQQQTLTQQPQSDPNAEPLLQSAPNTESTITTANTESEQRTIPKSPSIPASIDAPMHGNGPGSNGSRT